MICAIDQEFCFLNTEFFALIYFYIDHQKHGLFMLSCISYMFFSCIFNFFTFLAYFVGVCLLFLVFCLLVFIVLGRISLEFSSWVIGFFFFNSIFISVWVFFNVSVSLLNSVSRSCYVFTVSISLMFVFCWA